MFRLMIDTSNAAFEGAARGRALAKLLREVAKDPEAGYSGGPLRDLNGNTVGRWSVDPEEKE